jgi:hypothetical protein
MRRRRAALTFSVASPCRAACRCRKMFFFIRQRRERDADAPPRRCPLIADTRLRSAYVVALKRLRAKKWPLI